MGAKNAAKAVRIEGTGNALMAATPEIHGSLLETGFLRCVLRCVNEWNLAREDLESNSN